MVVERIGERGLGSEHDGHREHTLHTLLERSREYLSKAVVRQRDPRQFPDG
jgi:hypothetical protein